MEYLFSGGDKHIIKSWIHIHTCTCSCTTKEQIHVHVHVLIYIHVARPAPLGFQLPVHVHVKKDVWERKCYQLYITKYTCISKLPWLNQWPQKNLPYTLTAQLAFCQLGNEASHYQVELFQYYEPGCTGHLNVHFSEGEALQGQLLEGNHWVHRFHVVFPQFVQTEVRGHAFVEAAQSRA